MTTTGATVTIIGSLLHGVSILGVWHDRLELEWKNGDKESWEWGKSPLTMEEANALQDMLMKLGTAIATRRLEYQAAKREENQDA